MSKTILICAAIAFSIPSQLLADGQAPKPFGALPAEVPNRRISDDDRARQVTNDFAVCVSKVFTKRVEQALSMKDISASYQAMSKIATSDCLGYSVLSLPAQLFRGGLFRALYIRDFGKMAPSEPPVIVDYVSEAGTSQQAHDFASLTAFGSCVAKLNPAASRTFVISRAATAEERDAIDNLRAEMGGCLKDGSLKLSRAVLQSILAEVLYREAGSQRLKVAGEH